MLFDETIAIPDLESKDSWTGRLSYVNPQQETELGGTLLPEIDIRSPSCWTDSRIMGNNFIPPDGGYRYAFVRFPFTIVPFKRQVVSEFRVRITLTALGEAPNAFDMVPGNENETVDVERTLTFSPSFHLETLGNKIDISAFEASRVVKVKIAAAAITTRYIMSDRPEWTYVAHTGRPLHGSQSVYLVLQMAPRLRGIRALVDIEATVNDTMFGKKIGFLSESSAEKRTFPLRELDT